MVKVSYHQKPYRRSMMETWGASVVPSPSEDTNSGRAILAARSRFAREPWHRHLGGGRGRRAARGHGLLARQRLNHVLLHQTVIGQEALAQMELAGAFPDVVVGCVGGGSNFAGLAFPFLREKIAGRRSTCSPASRPRARR